MENTKKAETTENYNFLSRPPKEALRTIQAGRLKGKTDINPQWRYEAMNSVYGECGIGWKYEIVDLWTINGANEEISVQATIKVFTKENDKWSDPIWGIGGSMLVSKEKNGLYTSDEAYKMAVTDALSVALKYLGVGADIYKGLWDGSKYIRDTEPVKLITEEQILKMEELEIDMIALAKYYKIKNIKTEMTSEQAEKAITAKENQKFKEEINNKLEDEAKKVREAA